MRSASSVVPRPWLTGAALALACSVAGCGADAGSGPGGSAATGSAPVPSASADPSIAADPMATPVVSGLFAIGPEQRKLALRCWGSGSPTVLFDSGSLDPGIARWQPSKVVADVSASTRVCAYDRAGLGGSDPAPNRPRVLDDVVGDLHLLLAAAKIEGPLVLVGASGGGFDVFQHAGRYPADVAGLVMLDVPAGQANMSHADGPPDWDSADNPEHLDYYAIEHQMAVARLPIGPIPVTVVTASEGQSARPAEQRVWLTGSSGGFQTVLQGGHDIASGDPVGVLKEILGMVGAVRAQ